MEIHNLFIYPYYGGNIRNIVHKVDEVCKKVETGRLPPGAKRGGKKKDSSNPFACPSSKRMFGFFLNRASSDHQD